MFNTTVISKRLFFSRQYEICRDCSYVFLFIGASNPAFCVPSQFVSWSAHPLEPPSETYVSALHDMWSTKVRKLSMALSVNWISFVAKSFVQLVTHSCLKSVKPCQDISDKNLFAADSIQALESNSILLSGKTFSNKRN